MLYSIDNESYIKKIPHIVDYNRWRTRISDDDYQAIHDELHSRMSVSKIETSSWIPGRNWNGTVFQPIYDACESDENASAKFFGLILWHAVMEHDKTWSFGRYRLNDIPIEGLTYFEITIP